MNKGLQLFGGTGANAEEGDYWQNWRSGATISVAYKVTLK